MKNQPTKSKSTIIHILAACLVLAVLGPPAAELARAGNGRGGPPGSFGGTLLLPGICGFDVQVSGSFKQGVISLPGGDLLIISPENFPTFTNLSDPSKSVTFSNTGPAKVSTDQNGNILVVLGLGRGVLYSPSFGLKFLIGEWTFTIDANTGYLIDGPTGNGQIIDICTLID
jgi:hypothetical protein